MCARLGRIIHRLVGLLYFEAREMVCLNGDRWSVYKDVFSLFSISRVAVFLLYKVGKALVI